jgi:hypothetical protein
VWSNIPGRINRIPSILLRCPWVLLLFMQIKEKLLQLTEKRKEMIDKWEDRWEWLRLSKDILHLSFCFFRVSMESMHIYFPVLIDVIA